MTISAEILSAILLTALFIVGMFVAFLLESSDPKEAPRYLALSLAVIFSATAAVGFFYPPLFALVGVTTFPLASRMGLFLFGAAMVAFVAYLFCRFRRSNRDPRSEKA